MMRALRVAAVFGMLSVGAFVLLTLLGLAARIPQ
jgi:hypothetical protein